MIVHAVPSGPYRTNAYIIACSETRKAVIIDPSPGSSTSVIDYLSKENLQPEKILITHSHWDHIADTSFLKEHFQIPVFVHMNDVGNLEKPGSDGLPFPGSIQGVRPDGYLEDGKLILIGNLEFKIIHTPGHSPGGVCLYSEQEKVLIAGDTLFKGAMGSLSLPTAQVDMMKITLRKLGQLPKETRVYPGHGPSTTIGDESWLKTY